MSKVMDSGSNTSLPDVLEAIGRVLQNSPDRATRVEAEEALVRLDTLSRNLSNAVKAGDLSWARELLRRHETDLLLREVLGQ